MKFVCDDISSSNKPGGTNAEVPNVVLRRWIKIHCV